MRFDDLPADRVVIWGAGREGRAAYAELVARGVRPLLAVTGGDGAAPDDLRDVVATGQAAAQRLESAAVVVKSPGIAHTAPEFRRLRERGVPVTSLTDLWLHDNAHRVVAVTGTKGKSTTSTWIHHLLERAGVSASLVGNGGTPVTVGDRTGTEVAVAEISSYQAADLTASPRVAVLTSLFPEHLPWHGGFERYVADKLNLVAHGPEVVVVPDLAGELARLAARRLDERTRLVSPAEVGLSVTGSGIEWDGVGELAGATATLHGRHNLVNVALALTAVTAFAQVPRGSWAELLAAAGAFPPLPHRLEVVPSADGRTWVDDGLATAPEAAVAALETYPGVRVTLLLGGADRGLPFDALIGYLADPAPAAVSVVAVGPAGARFAAEAAGAVGDLWLAPGFAAALERIAQDPDASDVVLLSPAAPSFDEFASFEERSAAFRTAAARGR